MSVRCSQCDEELFGAVNRCWRCGQRFAADLDSTKVPPVRRSPIEDITDPGELVVAEVVQPPSLDRSDGATTAGNPVSTIPPVRAPATDGSAQFERRDRLLGAFAIASLVLGLLSLWAGFYTAWALLPSLVGLVLGILALDSKRRGTAILGVGMCCVALAVSGFRAAVEVHTWYKGFSPFEQAPIETDDEWDY